MALGNDEQMKINRPKVLRGRAAVRCDCSRVGACSEATSVKCENSIEYRNGAKSQQAFALAEVVLTLIVLGILAVIVCPKIFARHPYAGPTAAISQMANFNTALEAFHSDTGNYPRGTNGLLDLVRRPLGATNWQGPYLEAVPADPWGRAYIYDCPGQHTASRYPYDLMCLGPPGGNAPIYWSSNQITAMPAATAAAPGR